MVYFGEGDLGLDSQAASRKEWAQGERATGTEAGTAPPLLSPLARAGKRRWEAGARGGRRSGGGSGAQERERIGSAARAMPRSGVSFSPPVCFATNGCCVT